MLGKLSVSGRPTNLDNSRARGFALAAARMGVVLTIFLSSVYFSFLSPSLGDGQI